MREFAVTFQHGLGDCVNFALLLELYRRHGCRIAVNCRPNKSPIFRAARVGLTDAPAPHHRWRHAPEFDCLNSTSIYRSSKLLWNFNRPPLPWIGNESDLWIEYCGVSIDFSPFTTSEHRASAARFVEGLPRPVILLNTHGSGRRRRKDLSRQLTSELYQSLLKQTGGSLVLLDWHGRVPKIQGPRQRHLLDDWGAIGLEELYCLMQAADLLIGIDSGPFHFSHLTNIRTLGIWTGHHPTHCTRPRQRTTNLVPRHPINTTFSPEWNLVEYEGGQPGCSEILSIVEQLLPPLDVETP